MGVLWELGRLSFYWPARQRVDPLIVTQPLRHLLAGVAGKIGRAAVDHDREDAGILRESDIQLDLALSPGRVARQQTLDVAVHRQMTGGIPTGAHG